MSIAKELNIPKYLNSRLLVSLVIVFILIVSTSGVGDKHSNDYVDRALFRAGAAFVSARALNALISPLQSSTISVQMLGGASFGVGEILDPINDLAEQYSTVMKLSIASLLIQKLTIEITAGIIFKVFLVLSGLFLILAVQLGRFNYVKISGKIFLFMICLRFAISAISLATGIVSHFYIDERGSGYVAKIGEETKQADAGAQRAASAESEKDRASIEIAAAQETVKRLQSDIEDLEAPISIAEQSVSEVTERLNEAQNGVPLTDRILRRDDSLENARRELSVAVDALDDRQDEKTVLENQLESTQQSISENEDIRSGRPMSTADRIRNGADSIARGISVQHVKAKLEGLFNYIVRVMSLFVLETLLLPLLFLFLFSKGIKALWGVDLRELMKSPIPQQDRQASPIKTVSG